MYCELLQRINFMNFWVQTFFDLIINMSEWSGAELNWTEQNILKRVTQHRMTCDNENSLSSIIADFIIISFGVYIWSGEDGRALCGIFVRSSLCLWVLIFIERSQIIYWFITPGSIKHMGVRACLKSENWHWCQFLKGIEAKLIDKLGRKKSADMWEPCKSNIFRSEINKINQSKIRTTNHGNNYL